MATLVSRHKTRHVANHNFWEWGNRIVFWGEAKNKLGATAYVTVHIVK